MPIARQLKRINFTQASCSIEIFNQSKIRLIENPPLQSVLTIQSSDLIVKHLCPVNKPIFDICCGPGVVATALLNAGEKVVAFDYHPENIELVSKIQKFCPDRLKVIRAIKRKSGRGKTVIDGLYRNLSDNLDAEEMSSLTRGWEEESAGLLLGVCEDDYSSQQLLSQYLSSLLLVSSFFRLGRVEYFVAHDEYFIRKVVSKPGSKKYSRLGVLTNILCDVRVVPVKIPTWHVYPPAKRKIVNTGSFLNALHIVPKPSYPLLASDSFINTFLRACFLNRVSPIKKITDDIFPNSSSNIPPHLQMAKPQFITHRQFQSIINSIHEFTLQTS